MKCLNCGSENIVKRGFRSNKQKYTCKTCNASFTEGVTYAAKVRYDKKPDVVCPSCGSSNNVRDGKLESGHQRYKCKNCGLRHSAEHSFKPFTNSLYSCPICGSKNLKKKGLNKTKKYEIYQCKDCSKQFMPLNKTKSLTDTEKTNILSLYKLGVPLSVICESVERNHKSVSKFLKHELKLNKLRNVGNKQHYNRLRAIKESKLLDIQELSKFEPK